MIIYSKARLKQWIGWQKRMAKKLSKQRLDFPFHNKFETMDRLAKTHGEKIVQAQVIFSISKQDKNNG